MRNFRLLEYLGLGTVGNVNLSHIRDMIVNICCDFMDAPYAAKNFQSWKEAVDFYGRDFLECRELNEKNSGSLSTPDIFSSSLKEDFVLAQNDIIIGQDQVRKENSEVFGAESLVRSLRKEFLGLEGLGEGDTGKRDCIATRLARIRYQDWTGLIPGDLQDLLDNENGGGPLSTDSGPWTAPKWLKFCPAQDLEHPHPKTAPWAPTGL